MQSAGTTIASWASDAADAATTWIGSLVATNTTLVSSLGSATTTMVTGLAGVTKTFSNTVSNGLADFVYGASVAGNERAKEDTGAEADFSKDLIIAQADFNDQVAIAEVAWAAAYAAAEHARMIAEDSEAADVAFEAAMVPINDDYDDSVDAAKVAHANQVGDALIARATKLGDHLIDETQSISMASESFTTTNNSATTAYISGETTGQELFVNQSYLAQKIFVESSLAADETRTGAEGLAIVTRETSLGASSIIAAGDLAGAEATYQVAAHTRTGDYYAAQSTQLGTPLAAFESDRQAGFVDWLTNMSPVFVDYAESHAEREADLAVALTQAEADVNDAIAGANTVLYGSIATDEMAMQGMLAAIESQFQIHVGNLQSTYSAAMSTEQTTLDAEYAESVKTYAIAEATAEKVYMVAMLNEVATAEADKALALANAELAQVITQADAGLAWSIAEAGEYRTVREGVADGAFGMVAPSLNAIKVATLAEVAHQGTWLTSVTSADNDYAMAQVTAYNDADIDTATIDSQYQTAVYTHQSTEFTTLAATHNLPYLDYRAAKTTALATHYSDREPIVLADAQAIATIYSDAQSAINALYTAYAASINTANGDWISLVTTAEDAATLATELAEKEYAFAVAGPAEIHQVNLAQAAHDLRIELATAVRDMVSGENWDESDAIQLHRFAIHESKQQFDAMAATANASRVASRGAANDGLGNSIATANIARTMLIAGAEGDLQIGEASVSGQRDINVATKLHDQAVSELTAIEEAVGDAFVTLANNPWANLEIDYWDIGNQHRATGLEGKLAGFVNSAYAHSTLSAAASSLIIAAKSAKFAAGQNREGSDLSSIVIYSNIRATARQGEVAYIFTPDLDANYGVSVVEAIMTEFERGWNPRRIDGFNERIELPQFVADHKHHIHVREFRSFLDPLLQLANDSTNIDFFTVIADKKDVHFSAKSTIRKKANDLGISLSNGGEFNSSWKVFIEELKGKNLSNKQNLKAIMEKTLDMAVEFNLDLSDVSYYTRVRNSKNATESMARLIELIQTSGIDQSDPKYAQKLKPLYAKFLSMKDVIQAVGSNKSTIKAAEKALEAGDTKKFKEIVRKIPYLQSFFAIFSVATAYNYGISTALANEVGVDPAIFRRLADDPTLISQIRPHPWLYAKKIDAATIGGRRLKVGQTVSHFLNGHLLGKSKLSSIYTGGEGWWQIELEGVDGGRILVRVDDARSWAIDVSSLKLFQDIDRIKVGGPLRIEW